MKLKDGMLSCNAISNEVCLVPEYVGLCPPRPLGYLEYTLIEDTNNHRVFIGSYFLPKTGVNVRYNANVVYLVPSWIKHEAKNKCGPK